jgi:hypothetical protein
MITIKTKFLGATSTKSQRVKATTLGGPVPFSKTIGLNTIEKEMQERGLPQGFFNEWESKSMIVAEKLRDELGYMNEMVCGSLGPEEFIWVFVEGSARMEGRH